jgi:hypothetical protein
MKHILIADNDLGFTFWLGEVLAAAGYQPWPACSVSDAIELARRKCISPVELLVLNPSLRDASHLISHFRRRRPHLGVIALGSRHEMALPGVDAWRERPAPEDLLARPKWARLIDRIACLHRRAA